MTDRPGNCQTGKKTCTEAQTTSQDFFISVIETAPWFTLERSQAPWKDDNFNENTITQVDVYLWGNEDELPVLVSQTEVQQFF